MNYENPQLPEGINYSTSHPLKELMILLAGATVIVVVLALAISLAAGWLATKIPFATEQRWVKSFVEQLPETEKAPRHQAAQLRLQAMVDRVAQLQDLPADMKPTLHIINDTQLNAFATLGGHVFITCGLLKKLPNENALVAVLAHEVAHVKHRDPLVALGRGVAVMLALGTLSGLGDGSAVSRQLQSAGLLTALSFSRDQERAADDTLLHTLTGWYGYTEGAADLFDVLANESAKHEPPVFMSTHPATAERIAQMQAALTPGARVPLPAEIVAYAQATVDECAATATDNNVD